MILKSTEDGTLPEIFKDFINIIEGRTMKSYHDANYGSFRPVYTLSEISMECDINVRKLRKLIK